MTILGRFRFIKCFSVIERSMKVHQVQGRKVITLFAFFIEKFLAKTSIELLWRFTPSSDDAKMLICLSWWFLNRPQAENSLKHLGLPNRAFIVELMDTERQMMNGT